MGIAIGLPILVGLGAWLGVPWWVERRATQALAHMGHTLGIDIRADDVAFTGLSRLTLRGVTVRVPEATDAEPPLATIEAIEIDIATLSLFAGKARLLHVDVVGPSAVLRARADGSDNFEALRARVVLLAQRVAAGEADTEDAEGLLRRIDRHFPEVVVSDGSVTVEDASPSRRLLPVELGDRIHLDGVQVSARNTEAMTDRLRIEVEASAEVPLVGSHAEVTAAFDREAAQLALEVKLVGQSRIQVGGWSVSAGQIVWARGGDVRLSKVAVGDVLTADQMALELRDAPEGAVASGVGRILARIRRVALVDAAVHLDATVAQGTGDDTDPLPIVTPAAEGTAPPPGSGRPKLTEKKGETVRRALTSLFHGAADRIRQASEAAKKLGRAFPLPELTIRQGTALGGGVGAGGSRFDLVVRREDSGLVTAELDLLGDRGTPSRLAARVDCEAGDLQLHLQTEALELYPFRALAPASLPALPETKLGPTDLRLVYGAAAGRFEVSGTAHVEGLAARVPAVADETMTGISLGGEVHATLDLGAGVLHVERSALSLGAVAMAVSFDASDLRGAPVLTWSVDVPRVPAQKVVDSLPAAFLGQLEGLRVDGAVSYSITGSLDTRDMESLKYDGGLRPEGLKVADLGRHIDFKTVNGPFVHRVQEKGGGVYEYTTGPGAPGYVPYQAISPYMAKVLTTTEDGTFWRHQGIAYFAIRDALVANLVRGRFYRGASTVTQQLVKNLFLTRQKTISRKLQELFLAWQIERFLTKERIMELYLNIVELGPGVYGIGKAARYYFGKTPAELSLVECAHLGSILPNPRAYHYLYTRGQVTDYWRGNLKKTLEIMAKRGTITPEELAAAAPYAPVFRPKAP